MTGDINPIKEISIDGDTAYATVKGSIMSVQFIKEYTEWKIDLYHSLSFVAQQLEVATQLHKISKQELCIALLKRSAIEIPETIWESACKE